MIKTIDDLLKSDLEAIFEHNGYFYVKVKSSVKFDNRMWKVNANTKAVELIFFTDYLREAASKAVSVDVASFKAIMRR